MCMIEFPEDLNEATYISEFEEWNNRLNEELSYMLDQPATEENMMKIGAIVQHFFSDPMFHHNNHEVHVIRLPDGGLSITVAMDYDDAGAYAEDFDLPPGEDVAIQMMHDDIDLPDDDMFLVDVLFNYAPDPDIMHMAEAAYRAALAEAQMAQAQTEIVDILKARVEKKAAEAKMAQEHARMSRWHDRALIAMEGTAAGSSVPTQSPDDILFSPIISEEDRKKQEEQKRQADESYMYDCGD